jgi:SulP family sulfate permease
VIRQLSGGIVIGLTATVFVISFASIIYTGPLSPSLDRGIGLALLGAGLMSGAGAMLFSFRGTVMHPQDVTAVLLSGGAATIAASGTGLGQDALFATVAVMIALSTALAGVACVLFGRLHLGFVARYLPYPVLGGFLAATGYLLLVGGIGVTLDESVSLWTLAKLLEPDALALWTPWTLGGAAMVWITRRFSGDLVLPLCTILSVAMFYAALVATGTSLSEASTEGWLLGPFTSSGFLNDLDVDAFGKVDWPLLAQQAPLLIAVVVMTVLGALLNMTGINHILGHRGDLDADLRATGYSNLIASGAGGLVGYPTLGESVLGARLGLRGSVAGVCVAGLSLAAVFFGADLLELFPRGLFGMLLIYLGIDLLWTWLWSERQRLQPRDFAIVIVILAVAATVGFLEALAVGIIVSMTLFIISYARLDFVRLQTTLANRRSMVERSDPARSYLTGAGKAVIILELTGVLFFGTATRLRDRILAALEAAETPPAAAVFDFRRVRDLDASAAVSLGRTFDELRGLGIDVRVCALTPVAAARLNRLGPLRIRLHPTLDDALQDLEETLLHDLDPVVSERDSFLGKLRLEHPGVDFETLFPVMTFDPGALLIEEGSPSDEIFILIEGEASALVGSGERARVVARFQPGALIGEMAYYGADRRSASVQADQEVRAIRVEARQLGPESTLPSDIVSTVHRLAAGTLSQRLARTTRLLRDADG